MIQFDEHIFQISWNHQLDNYDGKSHKVAVLHFSNSAEKFRTRPCIDPTIQGNIKYDIPHKVYFM